MTMLAAEPATLRGKSWDELADLYREADDDTVVADVLAEMERRQANEARVAPARAARAALHAEWYDAAHADFLAAEHECRGYLLNDKAARAGVTEPFGLWARGRDDWAWELATDELRDYWLDHPRLTFDRYLKQNAAARRAALAGIAAEAETETDATDSEEHDDEQASPWDPPAADLPGGDDVVDRPAEAGLRHGGAPDLVRPDGGGLFDAAPQAGQVRHPGPVQRTGGVSAMGSGYTTYADPLMAAVEPAWLVPGFLEFGQVVLLTGPGGCGKSFLTANWAASATRGELPGLDGEPANVGLVNMEDDPNTSTAWRLAAEAADLGRVIDLSESAAGEPLELPRDTGMLRRAIDENNIKLLIIDPLSAVSSRSLTTVLQARKIIMPLLRAARETGCVILIVHHVTKAGTVAGSKGLVDSVRRTLTLAPDEQVPADRVLSVGKTNGTSAAPARFTIEGDGTDAHLSWLDREITTQRRTSWRDELAARRQARKPAPAPVSAQQAKAAGCRHSSTKFGTVAQCRDCPAARLKTASPVPPVTPFRPVPAVTYAAMVVSVQPGRQPQTRVIARGITDPQVARAMCEASPEAAALVRAGVALNWQPGAKPGQWKAGTPSLGFGVAAEGTAARAV